MKLNKAVIKIISLSKISPAVPQREKVSNSAPLKLVLKPVFQGINDLDWLSSWFFSDYPTLFLPEKWMEKKKWTPLGTR